MPAMSILGGTFTPVTPSQLASEIREGFSPLPEPSQTPSQAGSMSGCDSCEGCEGLRKKVAE